ncbi:MAG: hypothetical protein F4094_06665 [Synechococcus sp. SB0672_bin_6]|nr:hypothetical protein [Synechococcus sp. SB0675_bin_6]MYJ60143.1 hypothetical protein [Synechococcus sp. SB0672_bin_6]
MKTLLQESRDRNIDRRSLLQRITDGKEPNAVAKGSSYIFLTDDEKESLTKEVEYNIPDIDTSRERKAFFKARKMELEVRHQELKNKTLADSLVDRKTLEREFQTAIKQATIKLSRLPKLLVQRYGTMITPKIEDAVSETLEEILVEISAME